MALGRITAYFNRLLAVDDRGLGSACGGCGHEYGRAVVREPLSMRIGWANDDLVRNILRTVCETPTAVL